MRGRMLVGGRARIVVTGCALLVALVAVPSSVEAAFPGENGKISFNRGDLWTINPDGTNESALPLGSLPRGNARWSPDGTRFAANVFVGCGGGFCTFRIATYAADGTDEHVFTQTDGVQPSWSPDGQTLVFACADEQSLCLVDADGSNGRVLASPSCGGSVPSWSPDGTRIAHCLDPTRFYCFDNPFDFPCPTGFTTNDRVSWSPDGKRIAYARNTTGGRADIHVATLATNTVVRLTSSSGDDRDPAWSPDGTRIAFVSAREDPNSATCAPTVCLQGVYVMNSDGSNPTRVSSLANATTGSVDWQPLPVDAPTSFHARPKAATPLRIALVPTFQECTAPNSEHGPPLAFGSCSPPVATSSRIVVGATGGLQAPNKSIGYMRLGTLRGDPAPPDDSDVHITFSLTNVMYAADFSDYPGELAPRLHMQVTEKELSGVASTIVDFPLHYTVQCTPTADTTVGSTCAANTTINALVPGAVGDLRRAIWELDQVQVYDGGNDGDVDTQPNFPFATQGVFVP